MRCTLCRFHRQGAWAVRCASLTTQACVLATQATPASFDTPEHRAQPYPSSLLFCQAHTLAPTVDPTWPDPDPPNAPSTRAIVTGSWIAASTRAPARRNSGRLGTEHAPWIVSPRPQAVRRVARREATLPAAGPRPASASGAAFGRAVAAVSGDAGRPTREPVGPRHRTPRHRCRPTSDRREFDSRPLLSDRPKGAVP